MDGEDGNVPKDSYNPSFDTPLGQVDEVLYRLYKQAYAPTDNSGTYDYRGAYLAGVTPNTGSNPAQFGHFTDKFKKPNYPTFSVESQYAGAYPEKAGRWQGDTFIPPAAYQKGTTSVKKKYAKGTDSVAAMLTPREAILNRNAAELLGRDAIARLNAHGNMLSKRGVDLASLPSDPTPGPSTENMLGYQRGTDSVEDSAKEYRKQYGPTLPPPFVNEIPGFGVRQFTGDERLQNFPVRPYYTMPGVGVQPQPATSYGTPYERQYQMGTMSVGDDRGDLMRDADNTFYGGGQAPMPTPTPTPVGRGYQYGTEDVRRRRMNAASRILYLDQSQARRAAAYRNAPQGQIIQGSGAGSGGYGYTQGTGSLPPEQNPAYQAALRNNPTPASRYAQASSPASMVGTYRSDYGPRAVVSTGDNSFRTYDPQGGYIGRTGNAAAFLNKQFSPNPVNPAPAPTPVAPSTPPAQSVATTPTSLTVNSTGFQPQGLEANPFAGAPIQLDIQPRRYSDLY